MTHDPQRPRPRLVLLDPLDRPEPGPEPWRGPTDRGRRLMRLAREQLRGAPRWTPEPGE